ncbi:hypothetical protein L1887_25179 [Cichorium endivia]|nr:hypothetical protein L1887_25179 [Cichorium endivia]
MKKNPFFFSVVFFSLFITGEPDLSADRLAILAIRSAVGGRSILWNISQPSTPCTCPGVFCDNKTNRVVELHFPGMGLSGELPENTLDNLTQLTTLSLRYNALSGQLPADIFSLVNLRNLYLQNNLFSGPIPDLFSPLVNLEFSESEKEFLRFGIHALPNIRIVSPNVDEFKFDSIPLDASDSSRLAESLADFIESKTGLSIGRIDRPPILSKTQFFRNQYWPFHYIQQPIFPVPF